MDWLAYQLYLFDLDDTLINTRASVKKGCTEALNVACQQLGLEATFAEALLKELIQHFGTSADSEYWHAFVAELTQETDSIPSLSLELKSIYRQHYWKHLKPFTGVLEVLDKLFDTGKKIGLVSNGTEAFQHQKLEHTGLSAYFPQESIQISDQHPSRYKKPSPHMLHQLLQTHQVTPQEAVFFGNASIDIIAGNLAQITTVAVQEIPPSQHSQLTTPQYTIAHWDEFKEGNRQ